MYASGVALTDEHFSLFLHDINDLTNLHLTLAVVD